MGRVFMNRASLAFTMTDYVITTNVITTNVITSSSSTTTTTTTNGITIIIIVIIAVVEDFFNFGSMNYNGLRVYNHTDDVERPSTDSIV